MLVPFECPRCGHVEKQPHFAEVQHPCKVGASIGTVILRSLKRVSDQSDTTPLEGNPSC